VWPGRVRGAGAWSSSVVMVVKEMESKCSNVIVGVTLVISVALVVIQCSVVIQLQTTKADVARIMEQQRRRYDNDPRQAPCELQVSNCIMCSSRDIVTR